MSTAPFLIVGNHFRSTILLPFRVGRIVKKHRICRRFGPTTLYPPAEFAFLDEDMSGGVVQIAG